MEPIIDKSGRLFSSLDTQALEGGQKPGIHAYGSVRGYLLSYIGVAEACQVEGKTVYVNRKSLEKFLDRSRIFRGVTSVTLNQHGVQAIVQHLVRTPLGCEIPTVLSQ